MQYVFFLNKKKRQSAHLRGFAHRFGELLRGLRQQLSRNRVLCYICVHHEHRHDCNGETRQQVLLNSAR